MLKGEFIDIEILEDYHESRDISVESYGKRMDTVFVISPIIELSNIAFFIMTFRHLLAWNINSRFYFKFRVTYRLHDVKYPIDIDLLGELVFDAYGRVKKRLKENIGRSDLLGFYELPKLAFHEFRDELAKAIAEIYFR